MLKKNFKFISNKKNSIIIFNLSFVLLPTKVDFISEKQDYKKDMLVVYNTRYVKIVFIL